MVGRCGQVRNHDSSTIALSGNPTKSHLVANQEELGEGNDGIREISGSQDSEYEDDNLLGYSAV
jgi:hypothetical protein